MPNPVTWKFKYALLTYSQCDGLDPFEIVEKLSQLRLECIIGRELHGDGGLHLHAFVDAGNRVFRSRRVDCFDVGGFHPNVQHVHRTPWLSYDYAIKEGDVVAGAAERPSERAGRVGRAGDAWSEIMAAETRDEFQQLCMDLAPRDFAVAFSSLQRYADWRYRVDHEPYRHPPAIEFNAERVAGVYEWFERSVARRTPGSKLPLFLNGHAALKGREWAQPLTSKLG